MCRRWVFLPGMDGTGDLFRPFVSVLPQEIDATMISYPLDQRLSYSELVDYVQSRLPDERFVLIAESFSGPVAVALASSDSRVDAVVLCATFVQFPGGLLRRFAATVFGPFIFHFSPPRIVIRHFLVGGKNDSLEIAVSSAIEKTKPHVLSHRLAQVRKVDVAERLALIVQPVLLLQGMQDKVVPRKTVHRMTKVAADAELSELDGPHLLLQTRPQQCCERILSFLTSIPT